MIKQKEITCIICPIGCKILIKMDGNKINLAEGSKCKRGLEYAKNEALDPKRMLTTSVLVENGKWPLVSVKSSKVVPKEKIFDILNEIKEKKIKAPVFSGQIIIKNVANTSIDIIATKTIEKK